MTSDGPSGGVDGLSEDALTATQLSRLDPVPSGAAALAAAAVFLLLLGWLLVYLCIYLPRGMVG